MTRTTVEGFGAAIAAAGLLLQLADRSMEQPPVEQSTQRLAHAAEDSPAENERLASKALLPLNRSSKNFQSLRTESDIEGDVRMTLRGADGSDDRWLLSFEGLYEMHLSRREDGAVVCGRLDILEENKSVRYEPPVRLIPATVRAAESVTTRGRASVHALDTGEQTRSGNYEHTLVRVSMSDVSLPVGTIRCTLAEFDHSVDFTWGSLAIDLTLGTTEERGEGLVYWRAVQTIEKLGLFGETTVRELGAASLSTALADDR